MCDLLHRAGALSWVGIVCGAKQELLLGTEGEKESQSWEKTENCW